MNPVFADKLTQIKRLAIGALLPLAVFAGTTGLPWERPIAQVSRSFAGPVMLAMGIMILAVLAIQYSIHGEFGEIARRFGSTFVILGIGFGATLAVAGLYFTAGAIV